MPNIGTPELIIGLIVIFLLFGAKRMPEMARGIGQSLKIFKTEMSKPVDSDAANTVVANPVVTNPVTPPTAQAAPEASEAPVDPQARPAQ